MPRKRTIAVVTGSRAEFGLLFPVLRAIAEHRRLQLRTIVAGLHLATRTWRDVRDAGIPIDARVPMQKRSRVSRAADVAALGRGVTGFGRVFVAMKPDVAVVLGDRIEVLAAGTAASVGGFRLAHIHGGDRAGGVSDEAMRHAVTKLAQIHFPATASSCKRLIRMGELPDLVFAVGSPAVDGLDQVKPLKDPPQFIIAQHPVGAPDRRERQWMSQTIRAVKPFSGDDWILVVGPNRDPGSNGIRQALGMADGDGHLPRADFLAALAGTRAIVGNTSAGLIEAAALRVPCVNIGPRQTGREQPGNVVCCDYGEARVSKAIRRALRLDLRRLRHPYGDGRAGERIADWLATLDLADVPLRKQNTY